MKVANTCCELSSSLHICTHSCGLARELRSNVAELLNSAELRWDLLECRDGECWLGVFAVGHDRMKFNKLELGKEAARVSHTVSLAVKGEGRYIVEFALGKTVILTNAQPSQ